MDIYRKVPKALVGATTRSVTGEKEKKENQDINYIFGGIQRDLLGYLKKNETIPR
jgi:hypothetical protein